MIFKKILTLLSILSVVACDYHPDTPDQFQSSASSDVIHRLLGKDRGSLFNVIVRRGNDHERDQFTIIKTSDADQVLITGTSGVAACWGFHYYLKTFCNCHISWDGDQLELPNPLPNVNITIQSFDEWRYYQNVVTTSYSFIWWNWTRWEREIDWMALNGINLALAFNAQEAIWQRVYDGLGIKNDFTGPGFLAWLRMGNMRSFGGGLSYNWHYNQIQLQHQILNRMRELGITPVVPAFSGFVPNSFLHAYPLANVTNMTRWNNFADKFCCPLLLDSNDPMFYLISRIFLREYIEEFGTNHIYSCDTFNENTPLSNDVQYLAGSSKAVYNGISQVDPKAIWLLQGWMFIHPFWGSDQVRAYITSVPQGKLLILDLQADLTPQYQRFDSFYGQPFIWCMLHNFGGQLGLYGFLEKVNNGVVAARANTTMVGIGIAPEGINQNYVMYELMLESSFRNQSYNLTNWISNYSHRRYGHKNKQVETAWQLLQNTVYNFENNKTEIFQKNSKNNRNFTNFYGIHISLNVLVKRPSFRLIDLVWYNKKDVYVASELFIAAANDTNLAKSLLFQHDLVDVTRQAIQLTIGSLYEKIISSFRRRDFQTFHSSSIKFLELFDDLDKLLATNKKFLLGVWLEDAKALATNNNETINYEYNARNQITLWGPNGEIRDYAAKQWSGLIAHYYKPRWQIFINYLNESLINNTKINTTILYKEIFTKVEQPFTLDNSTFPTQPVGNLFTIASEIQQKLKTIHEFLSKISNNSKRTISDTVSLIMI